MALHLPTFFTRLGSAIVFSLIMMAGLLWHNGAFVLLTGLIMILCMREYFIILKKIFLPEKALATWTSYTILIPSILALTAMSIFLFVPEQMAWAVACCSIAVVVVVIGFLASMLSQQACFGMWAKYVSAIVYILLPMVLLLWLRNISLVIPVALILMIWMNDTMAYLVGSFIGKTPFSKISPKKTWEGTIGGVLLTLIGAAVWGYFSPHYRMIDWMALALCAAIAGTIGDLFESKLKRMADVKDSGAMMPGHGGALDRFDSLLIATPFAFAYAINFMPPIPIVVF